MSNIFNEIDQLKATAIEKLKEATSIKELNDLKIKFLGKKGPIQGLMKHMKDLTNEERPTFGAAVNEIKHLVSSTVETLEEKLHEQELNARIDAERIDVSLPGFNLEVGSLHPLTRVTNDLEELFISMGYEIKSGPEVETDLYTFEMLNLPKGHPARDMQDSFYITEEYLMRTHTSPVQVRTMLANEDKTPMRIICPGKVYRRDDDDATHSHQFMQLEGLVIDEEINLAHLKGTLEEFAKKMFGKDKEVRFRPSFFPFTEPSVEVDISCVKCSGKGCSMCKETGWIEVLGAGMVHPNVLEMSGYDSKKYSGFAFGMGIERIAMLKYGVTDIRHFYTNDLRFLEQFNRVDGGNK